MGFIASAFKFVRRNFDPSFWPEVVDISANDWSPVGGGLFRGLNASVAGQITVVRVDGTPVPVYVNTGWNPQGGKTIKHGASGDTATILAAEIDK